MTDSEIREIMNAYEERFGVVPLPIGISDEGIALVLKQYMEKGRPVPKSYNWYKHVPPGAVV